MTAPETPWVDSPDLDVRLARMDADEETRAFARSLRDDGMAIVGLGPEAEVQIGRIDPGRLRRGHAACRGKGPARSRAEGTGLPSFPSIQAAVSMSRSRSRPVS